MNSSNIFQCTIKFAITGLALGFLFSCSSAQKKDNGTDSLEALEAVEPVRPGVDLGLSVTWAECNVGADSPEEVGYRIPLGNTTGTMKYKEVDPNVSGTSHDIATIKIGDGWRMPTGDEFRELRDNCTWAFEKVNGRSGYRITGPNGNSIFLPCTGDNYQPESLSNLDVVAPEGNDANTQGNYWFGKPTDFNVVSTGLNQLSFDTYSGQRGFYSCEPRSLNAVRPVHD